MALGRNALLLFVLSGLVAKSMILADDIEDGPFYTAFPQGARKDLLGIEELDPAIVIPGHGEPFTGAHGAIRIVRAKLDAFARDPAKNARHALKVLFVFALLVTPAATAQQLTARPGLSFAITIANRLPDRECNRLWTIRPVR